MKQTRGNERDARVSGKIHCGDVFRGALPCTTSKVDTS